MLSANYYDEPEGKDFFGKVIATNKYAIPVGLAWSTVDTLMISHPKGYLRTIARYAAITGPCIGMATAFTLGTYLSTNVRGKDDRVNYIVGGFCAGSIYGAAQRSFVAGCVAGLIFAVAGSVKKLSKIEGWDFLPDLKTHGLGAIKQHDWTVMKERPKNWTTGKE